MNYIVRFLSIDEKDTISTISVFNTLDECFDYLEGFVSNWDLSQIRKKYRKGYPTDGKQIRLINSDPNFKESFVISKIDKPVQVIL